MATEAGHPARRPLAPALAFAAALALVALAFFFIRLAGARLACEQASALLRQNDWAAARARLSQAAADYGIAYTDKMPAAPWRVPPGDARRLYIGFGDSFLAEAAVAPETAAVFTALKNAESYFRAAVRLQPHDVSAQTGLARTTAALERGFAWLYPGKKNPYQAAPELEQLLRLRPNGIEAHFLFIHYLNGMGSKEDERLRQLTRELAAIYPPAADDLKKELKKRPDWQSRLEPAIAEGLQAAIAEGKNAAAYYVLSGLAEERGDTATALDTLLQALALDTVDGRETPALAWQYRRLAGLYLLKNDPAAQETALRALRLSENREQMLRELWRIYKENKQFQPFLDLLRQAAGSMRLPEARRIVQAACLNELGETTAAQASLLLVKDPQYQPEALRVLAEMARRDKNWDAMELAAQRATVIEPHNSDNFYLFAQSLREQRKYRQATEAMNKAIAAAAKEDPWLYNFRAWNHWSDNQPEAARADWLKAIELSPKKAEFYRWLAMTYEKEGNRLQAIAAMRKAVALAPDNADFLGKLQELQK
jgi:tetratricopeptide (TPR) repeat protein